jgi:SWI/SNF-related matrix-associated actin-dependent regulator 1 of chromatin subfamily A
VPQLTLDRLCASLSPQVLKDLPKKSLFVEYCPMTKGQAEIYRESEISSSKTLKTLAAETEKTKKRGPALKGKDRVIGNLEWDTGPSDKKIGDSGSNVLMNLRKAANHPLLFRSHYTDAKLKVLAKDIMKEPEHMSKDYACIIEDMEVRHPDDVAPARLTADELPFPPLPPPNCLLTAWSNASRS